MGLRNHDKGDAEGGLAVKMFITSNFDVIANHYIYS